MLRSRRLIAAASIAGLAFAAPLSPASAAGGTKPCRIDKHNADFTLNQLEHVCTDDETDALFKTLSAGDMPAYGSQGSGYWRWSQGWVRPPVPQRSLDDVTSRYVWQGKKFYTHPDGGTIINRWSGDTHLFPATATFGDSILDPGRSAIRINYRGCTSRPESTFVGKGSEGNKLGACACGQHAAGLSM